MVYVYPDADLRRHRSGSVVLIVALSSLLSGVDHDNMVSMLGLDLCVLGIADGACFELESDFSEF